MGDKVWFPNRQEYSRALACRGIIITGADDVSETFVVTGKDDVHLTLTCRPTLWTLIRRLMLRVRVLVLGQPSRPLE
jgi:hypothetical protein